MFKCLFMKKKLYDYIENSLSEKDKIKVKGHLNTCLRCGQELLQMKGVIKLAQSKAECRPNEEFWHNFQVELDRKLNSKLLFAQKTKVALTYRLRPVFAYLTILVFILGAGTYLHKKTSRLAYQRQITQEDENLADELEALDEATEGDLSQAEGISEDDPYLEELKFFYQLDEELL